MVEVKMRWQLEREVYLLIKGKDSSVMTKLIWERFRKSTIAKLSNEQIEILIPLLTDEYASRRKRLSGTK